MTMLTCRYNEYTTHMSSVSIQNQFDYTTTTLSVSPAANAFMYARIISFVR